MKNIDLGLLILRLSVGGLMLPHGLKKLFSGSTHIVEMFESAGMPGFLGHSVIIGEVIAPILMIIGFRTRLASLLFVFTCLVAIFWAHPEELFKVTGGGGWALELLGLYLFGSVTLFFSGAGKYALSKVHKWD